MRLWAAHLALGTEVKGAEESPTMRTIFQQPREAQRAETFLHNNFQRIPLAYNSHVKLNAPQRVFYQVDLPSSSGRVLLVVLLLLRSILRVCERIPNAQQVSRFSSTRGGGGSAFSADLAYRAEQHSFNKEGRRQTGLPSYRGRMVSGGLRTDIMEGVCGAMCS